MQAGDGEAFGAARGLRDRLALNRGRVVPGGVGDGAGRVADVIAVGRSLQAVIARGGPGELHLGHEDAGHRQVGDGRGRRQILFHGVKQVEAGVGQRRLGHVGQWIGAGE